MRGGGTTGGATVAGDVAVGEGGGGATAGVGATAAVTGGCHTGGFSAGVRVRCGGRPRGVLDSLLSTRWLRMANSARHRAHVRVRRRARSLVLRRMARRAARRIRAIFCGDFALPMRLRARGREGYERED